ncbi:MAG: hypothetical protein H6620_12765, partial [Halobacteriovoraceae bacterium]|nr:hypothetical protein [Halobacteriovoraceae bacterium]
MIGINGMVKLVILACGVVLVGIILYPLKKDVVFGKRGSIPNQHLMSFEDIDKALNKIPKKDQIQLRHFFNMCIGWDEFGYVLLGDKPMALSGFGHVKNPLRSFRALRYALSPRRIKYVNGYRAWKKYENLFPM